MEKIVKLFALGALTLGTIASYSSLKLSNNAASHLSYQQGGPQQGGPPSYAKLLEEMDADGDGLLSKAEVKGPLLEKFSTIDTDEDGFISEEEFNNAPKPQPKRK